MKTLRNTVSILFLASFGAFAFVRPASAACVNVPLIGNYTISTSCQFQFTVDGLDTTSGDNSGVLTIAENQTLTLAASQTLIVGSVVLTTANTSIIFNSGSQILPGSEFHVFTTDADGDLYPDDTTFATTGSIRRAGMTGTYSDTYANTTAIDCGPSSAAAKPGQLTPQTGTFTNVVNPLLTGDWNCNGVETKTYATASYTCAGCTNGSGYASYINATSGFSGSVPACGASGTYYTVSATTCADPAVANCTGRYTTSTVTQTCL